MIYCKGQRIWAYIALLITLIICTSLAAGCSRKPEKSTPRNLETEKKESPALKKLQSSIESIIKEYEKIYLMQTAPPPKAPQEEKQQESSQEGQSQEPQKSESGSEDSKQEGQQKQQQPSQSKEQTVPQPDWPKLEKDIADLHKQWNEFQTEALKSGAASEMIHDFSNTLNQLTVTLTNQALYEGLLTVNDLYGKTVDFEKLFKTKSPPEAKKIIYYGRMAVYKILNGDEMGATEAMNNALISWENVKSQVEDPNEAAKVQFSLDELGQAITERDPNLIKIKAQIAQDNVQNAIKSMEESKKDQ